MKINVLDKGYVLCRDHMGDDLAVVNDARVSFDKESAEFREKEDGRLLKFLAKADPPHTSPFRHSFIKFEIYAPLMVARQWWKYVVGSDHTMDAWNESSRRYVTEHVEFYIPASNAWRSSPENKKQGSGEPVDVETGDMLMGYLEELCQLGKNRYEWALKNGVCVEQARLFLPAYGLYVRWRWSSSLNAILHFLDQRVHGDAQAEIRLYAEAVEKITRNIFPKAVEAWRDE